MGRHLMKYTCRSCREVYDEGTEKYRFDFVCRNRRCKFNDEEEKEPDVKNFFVEYSEE